MEEARVESNLIVWSYPAATWVSSRVASRGVGQSHLPVQRMTDMLKTVNQSLEAQLMVDESSRDFVAFSRVRRARGSSRGIVTPIDS